MSAEPPKDDAFRAAAKTRGSERRVRTFNALLQGNLTPRRRGMRRKMDAGFAAVDWHDSRWFAVALMIVILCCADSFFTLRLLEDGAYEVNPFMAVLLEKYPHSFALAKIGLTSIGVIIMTLVARARVFGRVPVAVVLYAILLGYAALVAYEYWLCDHHFLGP